VQDTGERGLAGVIEELWRTHTSGSLVDLARCAREAAERFPESPEVWAVHSHCLLWTGQQQAARQAVARALGIDAGCATALAADAHLAVFEGRADDALVRAEAALARDDADLWVIEWAIETYISRGDTDSALDLILRMRQTRPDEPDWPAAQVTALTAAGRRAEAEKVLLEAEQRFPDCPRLWVQRSRFLLLAGQFDEAIRLRRKAAEAVPGSFSFRAELAQALAFAKRLDEAEVAARRSLEISPCSSVAMHALAHIHQTRGQVDEAEAWRDRAAEAIPALAYSRATSRANSALRKADWQAALEAVEPALSAPTLQSRQVAMSIRANALLELRRWKEAAEVLDELGASGYDAAGFYDKRAWLAERRTGRAEALAILRAGLQRYPTDGTLRARLLRLLHGSGDLEQERLLVEDIIAHPPPNPSGLVQLYIALDDTGHADEARTIRKLGEIQFPSADEFRLFDALDRLERVDLAGARAKAAEVGGEWADIGERLSKVAGFAAWVRRIIRALRSLPRDDGPPLVH
jgi:tetratricopeptide (TPR) repeat protein